MERQDVAQIIGRNVRHRPEKSFILPNLMCWVPVTRQIVQTEFVAIMFTC